MKSFINWLKSLFKKKPTTVVKNLNATAEIGHPDPLHPHNP
jgi:hypothetical protein